MATDTATTNSNGVTNFASGTSTGAGETIEVTLGFVPRYIRVFNLTDVIVWDKYEGMADTASMKQVAAGTTTADTSSAIVISGDADGDSFDGFTLSAALAASGKALYWVAYG